MDPIERLSALFERFPGIGPRQAGRFVQFLLRSSPAIRRELSDLIQKLSQTVHQCASCMRFYASQTQKKDLCEFCTDTHRDTSLLAIIASDVDLLSLEKSGTYKGRYFVLGGTISLASEKTNGLREKELLASLRERAKNGLKEVILAFPANPEGDYTAHHIRDSLASFAKEDRFKVTMLGRGLSTGSELEYADPDTLKSALDNRK